MYLCTTCPTVIAVGTASGLLIRNRIPSDALIASAFVRYCFLVPMRSALRVFPSNQRKTKFEFLGLGQPILFGFPVATSYIFCSLCKQEYFVDETVASLRRCVGTILGILQPQRWSRNVAVARPPFDGTPSHTVSFVSFPLAVPSPAKCALFECLK